MARHVPIENISPLSHSTYLGGCPVMVLAFQRSMWPAMFTRTTPSAPGRPSITSPFSCPPSLAQFIWASIFLQKRGREQPRGLPWEAPVTASDEVVPAGCFARVYEAILDEKWNSSFRKANHSGSPFNTSKKQALFVCVKMGNILFFRCLEDCFLVLKSQAAFFQ